MASPRSPFGRHLKSLATRLTLWMKPKRKAEAESQIHEEAIMPIAEQPVIAPKPKVIRPRALPKAKPVLEPKPISVPEPEPEPEPESQSKPSSLKNLVGSTIDLESDGKKHTLMIRTDSLYMDAKKFIVSASGGALGADVELDIMEVTKADKELHLKVGAFGKDATVTWKDAEIDDLFASLLKGKTVKATSSKGQTIELTPNNY